MGVGWDKMVPLVFKGREWFEMCSGGPPTPPLRNGHLKSPHLVVHMLISHFHPQQAATWFPLVTTVSPAHDSHTEGTHVILVAVHQIL